MVRAVGENFISIESLILATSTYFVSLGIRL